MELEVDLRFNRDICPVYLSVIWGGSLLLRALCTYTASCTLRFPLSGSNFSFSSAVDAESYFLSPSMDLAA